MVKYHKKGGRMRDISREQGQHQQEQEDRAYDNDNDNNIALTIIPNDIDMNESLDDSFMSNNTEEITQPPNHIYHYNDLGYILNPNMVMTEPLLVFNEYLTRILNDEHVMESLDEDNSLGYIAEDLLRLITYAPSQRGLDWMRYYLIDNRQIQQYPQITQDFLRFYRVTFINRFDEVNNVMRSENEGIYNTTGGKTRTIQKKRTKKNTKKRILTRKYKYNKMRK